MRSYPRGQKESRNQRRKRIAKQVGGDLSTNMQTSPGGKHTQVEVVAPQVSYAVAVLRFAAGRCPNCRNSLAEGYCILCGRSWTSLGIEDEFPKQGKEVSLPETRVRSRDPLYRSVFDELELSPALQRYVQS